jgi:uncharacterized protein (DUF169 family)
MFPYYVLDIRNINPIRVKMNKRTADIIVETSKKEKGNRYCSAVAKRREKDSVFCEKRSFLLEQGSKIL